MASTSTSLEIARFSSEQRRGVPSSSLEVQDLFVTRFTQIVRSYEDKKHLSSLESLERGPWYANDYALALHLVKKRKDLLKLKWSNVSLWSIIKRRLLLLRFYPLLY